MGQDQNLHRTRPLEREGASVEAAALIVVLVHGRGQDTDYMREQVIDRLDRADVAYVLPAAHENSWYPGSFLDPVAQNQPRLNWALERMDDVRQRLHDEGVADSRQVWLGFSQGACVLAEYVARTSHRFGALVCLTGGLFGPTGSALTRPVNVAGMPAIFATSDIDALVPVGRVDQTAASYRSAGAEVVLAVTAGAAHEIVDNSITRCRTLLDRLTR
jgi:phospholipase/carboxylesterase